MVNTFQQAKQIQERRVAAGKRGFAKAVRRFANRTSRSFLERVPFIAIEVPELERDRWTRLS